MSTAEFESELSILGVHIRTQAKKRLQANKNSERRDTAVYDVLRDAEGLKSDGELLKAISLDRVAYETCVALTIEELF